MLIPDTCYLTMSLSDYIKYLRAVNGGLTPWEIAEGSGVSAREIHLLEVKHRRIGEDDEMLGKLASFFNVPVEELMRRRDAYRKRLTTFLEESQEHASAVVLKLEDGEEIEGEVAWFAREAVAIEPMRPDGATDGDGAIVVQRGWVADWRRAGSTQWEVADSPMGAAEE